MSLRSALRSRFLENCSVLTQTPASLGSMQLVPSLRRPGCNLAVLPAILAVLACAPGLVAQCLDVLVLDPAAAPLARATVSVGSVSVPADSKGVASLCGLGSGPHSLVVTAPGFNSQELTVARPSGEVKVALEIETLDQELVVVGSRAEARAVTDSVVPVDLVPASAFSEQGDPDVLNQLRNVVPSFNVNVQPISGGAMIVRPANLRNLAPDHVLVLVNGKRRHRAALIAWHGNGVSDGSQGPDVSPIPSIALRQVEILRDGASAQYGSDAIAGVLNFTLKDSPSGGSVEVRTGRFYYGDGRRLIVAGNVGLPLGKEGFVNLSVEYGSSEPTSRSVQRNDARALIAAGNLHVRTQWCRSGALQNFVTTQSSSPTSASWSTTRLRSTDTPTTRAGKRPAASSSAIPIREPAFTALTVGSRYWSVMHSMRATVSWTARRIVLRFRSPTTNPTRTHYLGCSQIRTASRSKSCTPAASRLSSAVTTPITRLWAECVASLQAG